MSKSYVRFAVVTIVCLSLAVITVPAQADPRGAAAFRSMSRGAVPAIRGASGSGLLRTPTRAATPFSHSGGSRMFSPGSSRGGRGLSSQAGSSGLRGLSNLLGGGYGNNPFGYPGGYNPWEAQRRASKDYADAYRDAAIANAVVGLVGVLVNAHVQERAMRTAVPVAAAPVQPAGYYATQRTVVREGYYENRQVWVPEHPDPTTGAVIQGHHELHRVWVPPVYQESQVFVSAQPQPVAYTAGGIGY